MKRPHLPLLVLTASLTASAVSVTSQSRRPSTPVDPVVGVIDALHSHQIVALAEGVHNNEPAHTFRLALVRDPRFATAVSDIVVEFGNARFQAMMDRFISGGQVEPLELRHVWQDTTQAQPIWDVPIYEEFFRAVRAVNLALPPDRRIRVLLADPPINWQQIHSKDDLAGAMRTLDRDRYPAELIQHEVVAKNRRALLIYGDGHLARRDILQNFAPSPFLVPQLEHAGITVFSIWTETNIDISRVDGAVRDFPKPSLIVLRDTVLGGMDAAALGPETPRFAPTGNGPNFSKPVPKPEWRTLPMEEQFDAVLYLGRSSEMTMAQLPKAFCQDTEYMNMRIQRMTWAGMQNQIERLQRYCEAR